MDQWLGNHCDLGQLEQETNLSKLMNTINSHNSWSPLKEVWLGDVYPTHFYDHLAPEIRDVFQEITEITKHDLALIHQKLESFGITVCRPEYKNIEDHCDPWNPERLLKPEITPRDHYIVIGNTLYQHGPHVSNYTKYNPWNRALNSYNKNNIVNHKWPINGANVVRLGKDLIIDTAFDSNKQQEIINHLTNYHCQFVHNGGHLDGCFAVLKPGFLLASNYYEDYDRHFPNWKKIILRTPEFGQDKQHRKVKRESGKWWKLESGPTPKAFNQYVQNYALNWIGDYAETYFEINCLVIDENNVLVLGNNSAVFDYLESIEMTVHQLDFRARTFWDGGLHCLTVDIHRDSQLEDYSLKKY